MPGRMFRVETFVIVSYGPDIEYVRNLILESLVHEDWIMHDKPIQAPLFDFTELGVKFNQMLDRKLRGNRISEEFCRPGGQMNNFHKEL